MKSKVQAIRDSGDRLRIRPFIRDQVEFRLLLNGPLNSRWKEALALQSSPDNFPRALHLDLELMDTIWYYAGESLASVSDIETEIYDQAVYFFSEENTKPLVPWKKVMALPFKINYVKKYISGDKAVDINWYTKRLSLLAIYKATELAMSADKSLDFSETKAFLDRRFEDEVEIAKMLGDARAVPGTIMGVMEVAMKVAGLRAR